MTLPTVPAQGPGTSAGRGALRAVGVFCGSNFGRDAAYGEAMQALGRAIARAGVTLVYGGTHKGLMGMVADAALDGGARVHGVITGRLLARGHLHPRLTAHEVVDSLDARKARMASLADGFVATPGGIGTLDEFCAMWSMAQLEENGKPVALYNIAGFYDGFMRFVDRMVASEFLKAPHRDMVIVESDPARLLARMADYSAPTVQKWF